MSLWGNLWTNRLQGFHRLLPTLVVLCALSWTTLSRAESQIWIAPVLLTTWIALSVQQAQIYYFLRYQIQTAHSLRQRYAGELLGAAAGSLFWYFYSATVGFKGFAAFAIFFQILFAVAYLRQKARWLGVLLIPFLFLVTEPEPIMNKRERKQLVDDGQVLGTAWDPDAHVDLVQLGHNQQQMLLFEGGLLRSHLPQLQDNLQQIQQKFLMSEAYDVWSLDVVLPHLARHQKIYNHAALISAVGGQEVLAAKAFGAEHIWAIDINESAQKLAAEGRLKQNNLLFDRNVHTIHLDGRKFVERAKQKFDVIQIYSAHNASYSGTLGAYLQPGSLVTKEALANYIKKLSPDGILHIGLPFYLKIRAGFDSLDLMSPEQMSKHLFAITKKNYTSENDRINSIYFKKQPWTESEVSFLINWLTADQGHQWEILHNPLWPKNEQAQRLQKMLIDYKANPYLLRAASDDWPFAKLIFAPHLLLQVIGCLVFVVLILIFSILTLYRKRKFQPLIGSLLSASFILGATYAYTQNLLIINVQKLAMTPAAGLAFTYCLCLLLSGAVALYFQRIQKWMYWWVLAAASCLLAFPTYLLSTTEAVYLIIVLLTICLALQSCFFTSLLSPLENQLPHLFWMNGLGFAFGFLLHNINFVYLGLNTSLAVLGCLYLLSIVLLMRKNSQESTL